MLTIQSSSSGGTIFWKELFSSVTTNNFGLFTVVVGTGTKQVESTVASFDLIDWSVTPKYLKTEIYTTGPWLTMGVSQLYTVPYAMNARNLTGTAKLGIKGTTANLNEPLFEVKNKDGQTVFAVYNEGVRVYVSNGSKALKGGFAVGGFGTDSKTESTKYLFVDKDSVRIYLDTNPATKGTKGTFAVGGYDLTKGTVQNYMHMGADSIRMYIDKSSKGLKGGFAVGGYGMTKGDKERYLNIATDAGGIVSPAQNRILWYPLKNAFLTGKVLVLSVNDVGENSFAAGFTPKAKGMYSQAMGYMPVADGNYSTAIGKSALATGTGSYALGTFAEATNDLSFALGSVGVDSLNNPTGHTVASGYGAFAIGFGSVAKGQGAMTLGVEDTARGDFSTAIGYKAIAPGWGSVAIGWGTYAKGLGSVATGWGTKTDPVNWWAWGAMANNMATRATNFAATAFGDRTTASGHTSFATGYTTTASGHLAATFGEQTIAPSLGSFAIGRFNNYWGTAESWTGTDPLFMVGNGTSTSARSNAFTVYKNGNADLQGILNNKSWFMPDGIELNAGGSGDRYSYIDFHSDDTYSDYSFRIFRNSGSSGSTDFAQIGTGNLNFITFDNAPIAFYTLGAERMRIKSNGYIGINTSNPSYWLDVAGSININKGSSNEALYVNGSQAIWYNGTYYSWGYVSNYNVFARPVSIGTTGSPSPYTLWVSGTAACSSGTWTASDIRWKKDIEPLTGLLPSVMKLEGVKYYLRTEEFPQMNFDKDRQIGLIAQDVEKIFPELVKTDPNGYKAVSYEKLSVILLEGIKEQQKQIEALRDELEELKRSK